MKITFSMVYNGSLVLGIGLVGAGVWQFSHGAALVAIGSLVLAFTLYGAERLARLRSTGDR